MIIKRRVLLFSYLLLICQITFAQITFLEKDFYNQPVIEQGLLHPVGLAFDDHGTGYVWLKRGLVMVVDTTGNLVPKPLIDISEEVVSNSDHGLLGFALDPNFLTNGYFYLLYTVDRHHLLNYGTTDYDVNKTIENEATIGRITRYKADQTKGFREIVPNSRKVLVGSNIADRSFPILAASHGVGTLAFGEDGTLLASCGDAAAFERSDVGSAMETYFEQALMDGIIEEKENIGSFKAQQVDNLAGKIIRIDPQTGAGLPSNPFYDENEPNAARSRVWALGFRNPYRFTFKPETGDHNPTSGQPGTFIIGDVGAGSWEELSVLKKGGTNFGWPFYEGHLEKWQFWSNPTINQDAQNSLSTGANQCNEYFTFQDLIKEENEQQLYNFINPCGTSLIPDNIPTFVHKRPLLSYNNFSWNPPTRVMLSDFDDTGKAIALSVQEQDLVDIDTFTGYSVIPGFFYQAGNFPEAYHNKLFVADFSGWIKVLSLDDNDNIVSVNNFLNRDKSIVGLTQNKKDGCLYYIHFDTHSIQKICFGGNPPPVATIKVDKNYGASPLEVAFDATASLDPFGEALTYFWDFGNGDTSNLATPSFIFTTDNNDPVSREVTLIVTDEIGNTDESKQTISINNTPPTVSISSFSDGDKYPTNTTTFLPLTAAVTDREHTEEALTYNWQVFLHHNVHFHPEPEQNKVVGQALISPLGCGTEPYWYRVRLNVRDAAGLESFDEKEIFPHCDLPIVSKFDLIGQSKEDGNHLTWNFDVAADNLDKIELYRGENLQEMKLLSSSLSLEKRTLIDEHPINGLNHYQLRVYGGDGVYDFSNLVSLEFPPPPSIQIFPNPIKNSTFELRLLEAFSERIKMKIYTTNGQQIASFDFDATTNQPFLQSVFVPDLAGGIYWYEVENGAIIHHGNFVAK